MPRSTGCASPRRAEINYRRFFDVDDLVALHIEDPEVRSDPSPGAQWRRRGWVDGFRIDHPDGLLDPAGYFRRLAAAAFGESPERPPVYVEKILSHGERLRPDWPVAGTTGYDFLNQTEALFISPEGFAAIEREYHRVIRQPLDFRRSPGWASAWCSSLVSRPASGGWPSGCSSSPVPIGRSTASRSPRSPRHRRDGRRAAGLSHLRGRAAARPGGGPPPPARRDC
jgi:hypothetical protein